MSTETVSPPVIGARERAGGRIPATPRALGRIPELDGLRAAAIWLVLIVHLFFFPVGMLGPLPHWAAPLRIIGEHGWLGVDLFFVLSGFLITGILLDAKGRSDYFSTFYKRRAFRILPICAIVLAVLYCAYGAHFAPYFAFCALFIANFGAPAHLAVPNGAGPFWSLAVEEQFYLFWPFLVLGLNRRALAYAAGAIILIEPGLRILQAHAHTPGFLELTWSRCDGLAVGALLAIWFRSRYATNSNTAKLAAGMLSIVAVSIVVGLPFGILSNGDVSTAIRISQAVLVFGAVVAWAVSRSGSAGTAILRTRFGRYTAELSYCLYLIHVPLVDLWGWIVARVAPGLAVTAGSVAPAGLRAVFVLVCAYALATLSRRWIEAPAIAYAHRRRAT